jgi:N utilization substance protein B
MNPSRRSQARVLALQALCAFELHDTDLDVALNRFLSDRTLDSEMNWDAPPAPDVIQFARTLALGAWQQRKSSDALLERHVTGWSLNRIQPVDRNILRLGLYELRETPDTPAGVVINEAVELARLFGGKDSPAFVNGVLDGVRRQLDAAAGDPVPSAERVDQEAPPSTAPEEG